MKQLFEQHAAKLNGSSTGSSKKANTISIAASTTTNASGNSNSTTGTKATSGTAAPTANTTVTSTVASTATTATTGTCFFHYVTFHDHLTAEKADKSISE